MITDFYYTYEYREQLLLPMNFDLSAPLFVYNHLFRWPFFLLHPVKEVSEGKCMSYLAPLMAPQQTTFDNLI